MVELSASLLNIIYLNWKCDLCPPSSAETRIRCAESHSSCDDNRFIVVFRHNVARMSEQCMVLCFELAVSLLFLEYCTNLGTALFLSVGQTFLIYCVVW